MNDSSPSFLSPLIRNAWHYAGAERWRLVLFYAMYVVAVGIALFQPMVVEKIINSLQTASDHQIRTALTWCGSYALIELLFWLFHGPGRIIERRLAFRIYHNYVNDLYRKVTELPLRWHQDHHSGDTINRVTKAGKALFQFSQDQFIVIQLAVRFLGCVLMLAYYCWWVALVVTVLCAGIFLIIWRFDRRLVPLVNTTNEKEHHLSSALYDYIGNIVTVLTLRLQDHTRTEISHRFRGMRGTFWREITMNEWKWAAISIALVLLQSGVMALYIGVTLGMDKTLNIGVVVAIFQYQMMLDQIFFHGTMVYNELLHRSIDIRSVDSLLDDHAQMAPSVRTDTLENWNRIDIEGLCFTHDEDKEGLHHLHDVALTIPLGSKIAFVGSSGAGKSTLLTLLRGIYEPQQVAMAIDGRRYDSLKPLTGFSTLIPQDAEIFENTVRYNLTMGIDMSDALVRQAMNMAAFDEVLPKLPNGINTDIRERGVNMSGGQKQRLALARGLIAARDSSLLLLDEPTSSVDVVTEGLIFDRIFSVYAEKTIIASVHRLHLLPRFDWVCFMQNGVIVQQDTFRNLTTVEGPLRDLWESQAIERWD